MYAAHDPAELTDADLDADHMEEVSQMLSEEEDSIADLFPAFMTHPKTGRVQAASAYYGRLRRHVLDPSVLPDFDYLRTVHRGDMGVPTIGGRSLDDRTWLVVFMDGGPMRYYVYNRAEPLPSAIVAPSILFGELDIQRANRTREKLPQYPAPVLSSATASR